MKKVLKFISIYSEKLCNYFHWLNPITSFLGLGYCHLARFSWYLDEKYKLDVWQNIPLKTGKETRKMRNNPKEKVILRKIKKIVDKKKKIV